MDPIRITRDSIDGIESDSPIYYGPVRNWRDGLDVFYLMKDGQYIEFDREVELDLDKVGYELYFDEDVPVPKPSTTNVLVWKYIPNSISSSIGASIIYHSDTSLKHIDLLYWTDFLKVKYKKPLSIRSSLLTVYTFPNVSLSDLAKKISEEYAKGRFSYPWKRLVNTFPTVETIRSYKNSFDGTQSFIDPGPYELYKLTDYYSEEQRLSAHVKGHIRPIDALSDSSVVMKILEKGEVLTPLEMRERLAKNVREANQFKLTMAKAIYDVYGRGKVVMDMSMGWGDRLIAALSSPVAKYIGFDPNTSLYPAYQSIIRDFNESTTVDLHTLPFQDLGYREVDLAFTSPPYFDFEIYTDEKTQSSTSSSYKEWIKTFYYPMMEVAWTSLKEGGRLILHLGNTRSTPTLVEDAIGYMKRYGSFHKIFINDRISFYMWEKGARKPDLNPPFTYRTYTPSEKLLDLIEDTKWSNGLYKKLARSIRAEPPVITVADDSVLEGGTKQRGWKFIRDIGSNFYVVSTPYGYGQIVVAMLARRFGYKVRIYLEKLDQITPLTQRAIDYGAEVIEVTRDQVDERRRDGGPKNSAIQRYADSIETYTPLPFGLESPEFIEALSLSIKEADDGTLANSKSIWVAAGSGTVARALRQAFPKPFLNLVKIGRFVDNKNIPRSKIYDVNGYRNFSEKVRKGEEPPYDSVSTYDAKVWVPAVVVSWSRGEDATIFNIA